MGRRHNCLFRSHRMQVLVHELGAAGAVSHRFDLRRFRRRRVLPLI